MRTNGGLPSTPSDESDDDKLPSSDDGLMGLPGDDDEGCHTEAPSWRSRLPVEGYDFHNHPVKRLRIDGPRDVITAMDDFAEDGSELTLTASLSRLGANLLTDLILRRRVTDPPIVGPLGSVFPRLPRVDPAAPEQEEAMEHPSTSSSS